MREEHLRLKEQQVQKPYGRDMPGIFLEQQKKPVWLEQGEWEKNITEGIF